MPYSFESKKIVVFTSRKVASASLRNMIYEVEGEDADFVEWVNSRPPEKRLVSSRFEPAGWEDYRKIALVRNPVDRFVSLYKHRVAKKTSFLRKIDPDRRKARNILAEAGLPIGPDLDTFCRELKRYCAISSDIRIHILPQKHFLGPSLDWYDDVVKLEDIDFIAQLIGHDMPHTHKTHSEQIRITPESRAIIENNCKEDIAFLAKYYPAA
ncbi:sulfotransferase family 2 domain-containing protein [Parasphingopyxis marina]|uniref:Sulfotransferase family 2 domain-containing protein n=1 Tax=Parasphingopyxis marina TaxID=2761622 RepID=A0A842HUM0_9SPHN|nr:sulfotransferase family 2 domain-containing protein [Parasphingopyxis marina]MBC2776702.1 sulfotransferase family 2 domain-containing protein [Parasphingopyxis marina]